MYWSQLKDTAGSINLLLWKSWWLALKDIKYMLLGTVPTYTAQYTIKEQ